MKTKDKVYDAADSVKPYVDRALHDEDLRDNLKNAFEAAREIYAELMGGRTAMGTATRLATDKDIQDNLKRAVEELRTAADRVQGKEDHSTRNTALLMGGIALGLLFNPVTGPATRKWLMDKVGGGGGSDEYSYGGMADTAGGGTDGTQS